MYQTTSEWKAVPGRKAARFRLVPKRRPSLADTGPVRPTIVGHSENGNLGDGAIAALHATGPLVDGGQVGVHVAREAAPTGHLLPGSRHLEMM